MPEFGISKVTTLPASPTSDWIYIYKDPTTGVPSMYVTEHTGGALKLVAGAIPSIDDVLGVGNTTTKDLYVGSVGVTDSSTYDNYIDENGIFSNGSDMTFLSATLGIINNASVVGVLTKGNADSDGFAAAVVGMDSSSASPGSSTNLAGYFGGDVLISGRMIGFGPSVKVLSSGGTLTPNDVVVLATGAGTIYLPPNPKVNQMLFIYRSTAGTVTIQGNGSSIIYQNNAGQTSFSMPYGMILTYIGSNWYRMDAVH